MSQPITLQVNGAAVQVTAEPETPLIYILRNDLGLKSPKLGCSQEQCYACAVLVDGNAVPSCNLPVKQAEGLTITTLEGLSQGDELHPLQEAFVEEQAIQCGFCVSGMIVAAQGLLNRRRYPNDDEIRDALATNLCRCGVYDRVRRAILLHTGRPSAQPVYEVRSPAPLPPEWMARDQDETLSASFRTNPDLDDWLQIDAGGTVTIKTGKVEIGQGVKTALAQIAAEELDVSLGRMRVIDGDTEITPDEGTTAGSMSMQTSGRAMRQAAADARYLLLALAHEEMESTLSPDALQIDDGRITDPATGRSTDYWSLHGGRRFGVAVTGRGKPKPPDSYHLVGQPAKRLDLPDKVTGAPSFVHDMTLPNLAHGRVVRPPAYDARLADLDETHVEQMPGVIAVVRDGSFLAVVAEREEQAVAAAERLAAAASWEDATDLPDEDETYRRLLTRPSQPFVVKDGTAVDTEVLPAFATTPTTVEATYFRPYQMHASLGPSAAVAQLKDGKLHVWLQTQGVFPQRAAIAQVVGMGEDDVHITHIEGAGCYGHNGAEDAALDAALLARAVPGRPVSLKWSREDEHAWEPYGPAMVVKMQGSVDAAGQVSAWGHEVWSHAHANRPRAGDGESGFLAAQHLAEPFAPQQAQPRAGHEYGEYRNTSPLYNFPKPRIVSHFVPDSPLRTSALRSLGSYANVFAAESFIDELAHTAGIDPVEFRLAHMENPRARAVIEAAAEKASWQPRIEPAGQGDGRGFAFSQYKNAQCYAAIVVELTVDPATGEIKLKRAVIAADAGQVVNPDGLSNQIEGGFLQAASWTLYEAVKTAKEGIASRDWESYPILRFPAAPQIETVLLNRPELPFLGSGEASIGPTPAAIANAVFDAVGVRLRRIPFTAQRVCEALTR